METPLSIATMTYLQLKERISGTIRKQTTRRCSTRWKESPTSTR